MTVDVETLLTYDDVAALTKIKIGTLRKYVLRDCIPYCKLNGFIRFKPLELQKWIEDNLHRPVKVGAKQPVRLPAQLFEGEP
ncbi:hypothetical protein FACS189476_00300 [Spirochaetia bacterium]|nr:hypothetical protein FACS189476_00300 [Spirochaetia bacterium]